ncbi:hypothetical protein DPM13_16425 [Paracoccus mutanolyticus]|uniref:Hedgehog/Intein (Hint) domain-containing protein n=1 Tax=Paracoccus mutanolyticus TaxID=1499308 RepID=A0ABN5M7T7_9RHOB|nr:hypothetical protein [Paracoccus mutanolyticus]AWX94004.1 hypothetical protein DPM13_16425 [Paracoccus mutanolyticus]
MTRISVAAAAPLRATQIDLTLVDSTGLRPGQYFSVGERLHRVQQAWRVGAVNRIMFEPPLRAAVSAGARIEIERPVCKMRMVTETEGIFDHSLDVFRRAVQFGWRALMGAREDLLAIPDEVLRSGQIAQAVLVHMDFQGAPKRWWTGFGDLEVAGQTWQGLGDLISISPISSTYQVSAEQVTFDHSAAPGHKACLQSGLLGIGLLTLGPLPVARPLWLGHTLNAICKLFIPSPPITPMADSIKPPRPSAGLPLRRGASG